VVARDLPVETAAALLDAARHAFLHGLVVCQTIGGAGALVLAAFARVTFRQVSGAPASPSSP